MRADHTCMTRILSPVSCASCSRICLVGLGVAANAALRVSNCLALMVVRGPRRFAPRVCSSASCPAASLSEEADVSASLMSSSGPCSCRSGERLRSLHVVTAHRRERNQIIVAAVDSQWIVCQLVCLSTTLHRVQSTHYEDPQYQLTGC